jgi:meiotic recombination protein SPO11
LVSPRRGWEERFHTLTLPTVIEKEAVFQRLAEDHFYNLIPSILITGKGVPDLTTRQLVHKLSTILNIPVLGIFDYNPYGVAIWMMYRYGTFRMGGESYQLAVGESRREE